MTYEIRLSFDAAHFLPGYKGKCSRMHGHTWRVSFYVLTPAALDSSGIGYDFKVLRERLGRALPDHELLNDSVERPSAENVARHILRRAREEMGGFVSGLQLWESEGCAVQVWAAELEDGKP